MRSAELSLPLPARFRMLQRCELRLPDPRLSIGSVRLIRFLRWKRQPGASWATRHANGAEHLQERADRQREVAARPAQSVVRSVRALQREQPQRVPARDARDIWRVIRPATRTVLPWSRLEQMVQK